MAECYAELNNMRTQDVEKIDYHYVVDKPDRSFSPQHNQALIDETIRETEKFFKETQGQLDDNIKDRIDILSSYGVYRFNKGTKSIKEYLGRDQYNAIIGEKILSKIRVMDSVNKLQGNTKFKKGILL